MIRSSGGRSVVVFEDMAALVNSPRRIPVGFSHRLQEAICGSISPDWQY